MAIKHAFVSQIPDSGETGKVAPTNWNANHTVDDGTLAAAKLTATAQQFLVPSGGIIMWSGTVAAIPAGWHLCDGNNGTPDLRDKFVVGAKQDSGGLAKTNVSGTLTTSGGEATHVLSATEMPVHTHAQSAHNHVQDAHAHNEAGSAFAAADGATAALGSGGASRFLITGYHTATGSTTPTNQAATAVNQNAGSDGAHNNLPPYFALAFIMKSA